tara:strand:- start:1573 stop:1839 length:267 start_codon:yes stop_codon:yes gene_type:complete
MRFIVDSSDVADVEAAVSEHGGDAVYWLTDSTKERDAQSAGLPRNHILSIQNLQSMKNALEILGEGWSEYSAKPAPKPKAKKSAKKDE